MLEHRQYLKQNKGSRVLAYAARFSCTIFKSTIHWHEISVSSHVKVEQRFYLRQLTPT